MPNGGSDCCGTCWFNAKNKGEVGYAQAHDPEPDYCVIRQLPIEGAFWTYCANHPHHNPDKIDVPIGPAFKATSDPDDDGTVGPMYERVVWQQSPDTEKVRDTLLALLHEIVESPTAAYLGYPTMSFDDTVIWQLGEFQERRAIPDLQRIAKFELGLHAPVGRLNSMTASLALEALAKIGAGE